MLRIAPLMIGFAFLTGCGALALSDGTVRVAPASSPDAEYHVEVLNRIGAGFDADDPADRQRFVADILRSENCRHPVLLRERSAQVGTWALGRRRMTYASDWTCAAS